MLDRRQLEEAHNKICGIIRPAFGEIFKTGSVYINGKGDDLDIAVIYNEEVGFRLLNAGFISDNDNGVYNHERFKSFRRGDINVIAIFDRKEFERFKYATRLCRELREDFGKDLTKDLRVFLHEFIRGNPI